MGQVISLPVELVKHTTTFYRGLWYYTWGPGRTAQWPKSLTASSSSSSSSSSKKSKKSKTFLPVQPSDSPATVLFKQHARIHLFALTSNFYLWSRPHYRKPSYRLDLWDNLRNVAIPGTGVPLHWPLAWSKALAYLWIATAYPAGSFCAALHYTLTRTSSGPKGQKKRKSPWTRRLVDEYATRLLAPDDWFHYWRLNSLIVGMHAYLNEDRPDTERDYTMENKWTFLREGRDRKVPVSPFMESPEAIVVKHKNEEGGMGIFFYKNAAQGGDWIIQSKLDNADWVQSLLPPTAPLSTFRVITCSSVYIQDRHQRTAGGPSSQHIVAASAAAQSAGRHPDIKALSCVFRAGRQGASTDHSSILFDVDIQTGLIRKGSTNSHWYRLGWSALWSCPWRSRGAAGSENDDDGHYVAHPDVSADGKKVVVAGNYVPGMPEMLALVEQAHADMCPTVPLAGWDVAVVTDPNQPICLLEVNLSCNFFRGSFDLGYYLDFCEANLEHLQNQRLAKDAKERARR